MKRLTEKELYDGKVCFTKCSKTECPGKCADCDILKEANVRLKEYEDLEERRKLIRLPCVVDSEVWYIDKYADLYIEIVRGVIVGYLWSRSCGFSLDIVWDKPIMGHFAYKRRPMPFSEIGKTVFLTSKEAEKALKILRSVIWNESITNII